MATRLNWTINVQLADGPRVSASQMLMVDAYDRVDVVIDDGAADEDIEVQPGGAGQVQFLLIQSDRYGAGLSYKVNAAGADAIVLDTLQVLIGSGAVGLLGAAPTRLLFSNALGSPVKIQILVGRKATTP